MPHAHTTGDTRPTNGGIAPTNGFEINRLPDGPFRYVVQLPHQGMMSAIVC